MKKYKIVLTEKGKEIFKGANVEPISKLLITFKAKNQRQAEKIYYNKLSGNKMEYYVTFQEVENG